MQYTRAWFLGDQLIHVGDLESARQILNAEHDLVEGKVSYARQVMLEVSWLTCKASTILKNT